MELLPPAGFAPLASSVLPAQRFRQAARLAQCKQGVPVIEDYIERIRKARVYDVAERTPLELAPRLSERLGNQVLIKREDLQSVFSFKLRGAYNKMAQLTERQRADGVIAASAGNHAQGVALAAQKLGLRALVVMPTTTPSIKIQAVQARGVETMLVGDSYDDAYTHARKLESEQGLTFVHPYDDPDVIAGQGTIGMEILQQHRGPLHAVFVPVGGGGLIAGVSAYVKHLYPEVKMIGVEPEDAACLKAALDADTRVTLDRVGLFADGVAVRQVGDEPFRIARETVDEVVTVGTDEICAAIKDSFDDLRSVAEPAGALAVAGIKRYVKLKGIRRQTLVGIQSGANLNFDRLRHVAERADLGEAREAVFGVTIPECPGAFESFCKILGAVPVTEFNYRIGDLEQAHIFVGVGLQRGDEEREEIRTRLEQAELPVVDMSQNELAKSHVRFMVGGRALAAHERLVRFEFPERPGALLQFLQAMGHRWNITLFHYRNHGAAFGRVLAAMQVPDSETNEFHGFLDGVGYRWVDESDNPAYQLFLR
ncbi:MAG: threonine ammonia-lyase, biosynthetic [Candidatus Binatia bacterium]|nr:threonine ammonia-lyase, biosynthetic [Candidatus Binatia bacterium]MDG2009881.1 threonine ammonia-lyase, biosynthetic [Candidatus Binatia bacterium]